jgi:hypothetical protein
MVASSIDWHLVVQIATPIATLMLGILSERFFERKAKVVVFYGHVAAHTMAANGSNPAYHLNTHSIIIRNAGKSAAHNVRVRHHYLPPNFRVDPARNWTRTPLPNGGEEILFSELVPNETISISYLYFPPLTADQIHTTVISDEGFATVQNVVPMVPAGRVLRTWRTVTQLIGIVALLYLIVELLRWSLGRL